MKHHIKSLRTSNGSHPIASDVKQGTLENRMALVLSSVCQHLASSKKVNVHLIVLVLILIPLAMVTWALGFFDV